MTEPAPPAAAVYVIDDDAEVREYLAWLLSPLGYQVECFANAEDFLAAYTDRGPACLITDLRMPGMTGLELQRVLLERAPGLPMIMMSGHADVGSAVQALREGAVDFIEKPFARQALIDRVRAALEASRERRQHEDERTRVEAALARLTPRQHAVLDGLIEGKPSKIIASELGISTSTVDVHRFHLMQELGAQSLPDLFRLVVLVRPSEPHSVAPVRTGHS